MATQHLVLDTESLSVGRFVCPPGDARWSRENWIGPRAHVVFPARTVVIEQAGKGRLVADPNRAVLYDAGRTYRRQLVSPDGDVATFVALGEDLAQELLHARGSGRAAFPRPEVGLDAATLLRLRLVVSALEQGRADPLAVEVVVLQAVAALIDRAAGVERETAAAARGATRSAHSDLVEDARAVLSARHAERLRLADVAREVGASPWHLARIFRAATGQSLHAYRDQVRLRTALDRLAGQPAPTSLALLAAELGYASLSHLDARFRRAFGRSPAEIRDAARVVPRPARHREMRTILQGPALRRQ